ncbi:DNA repair protein rad13 [Cercospora beticola]|uniref:DNA repair protein rad13 n=1 Tax=Cercospora beticola TaxID=122368 RepID=A0A2G5I8H0_CERBT|nr:DNA repair protein rad13 [Cercospora beticola]PIB00794.1 DNA repair protein rad13 [Cercospora beticola]WPA97252.1 hypothetical protein RHO25_001861 [Cercospora beticola]
MGVTGLWQIVQPCARPIKIETLNRKRLAVDASIWIYQFLKAVRDKEGNALRNSHVVGFFRRICKLLFFGIKPVFVFDGGAPALKRQTIRARKSRREGRREDAVRTAGKLLAVQMQRAAEEEEERRRREQQQGSNARNRSGEEEEQVPDEGLVYVDELQMSAQERQQNRKFRKKDAYHLPDLDVSMSEMGGANDPRVMSLEELQAYAAQFNTGEELAIYDFSKIDYDSSFFMSLPASDRYNILNAARLRSRLRMGHSKEQLDVMFPDRMAFSRFQIERVAERNELTQRLMHLNESGGAEWGGGRVMGEKGREYVLVKNDGVEGGWALGVIDDEGKEEKPIDVDAAPPMKHEDDEWEDDVDFEDVPVEGLNRLPRAKSGNEGAIDALQQQRRSLYRSRASNGRTKDVRRPPRRKEPSKKAAAHDPESLFVERSDDEVEDEEWEQVDVDETPAGQDNQNTDDEDLRAAIALSMQNDPAESEPAEHDAADTDMLDAFQQHATEEARPIPRGSARDIAHVLNKRAHNTASERQKATSFSTPARQTESDDESSDGDIFDLQAALAESGRTKRKTKPNQLSTQKTSKPVEPSTKSIAQKAGFSGPLPFEKLDLGTSLLGKNKMQQRTEDAAGGFENPELSEKKERKAEPLPPWFSGDVEKDLAAQRRIELEDGQRAKQFDRNRFQFQERDDTLRRAYTDEVIDLEADDDQTNGKEAVIDLSAEAPSPDAGQIESQQAVDSTMEDSGISPGPKVAMEPAPTAPSTSTSTGRNHGSTAKGPFTEDSDDEEELEQVPKSPAKSIKSFAGHDQTPAGDTPPKHDAMEADSPGFNVDQPNSAPSMTAVSTTQAQYDEQDEMTAGSGERENAEQNEPAAQTSIDDQEQSLRSRSPSMEFEDVNTQERVPAPAADTSLVDTGSPDGITFEDLPGVDEEPEDSHHLDNAADSAAVDEMPGDDFGDFSDPEDAEILRNLTIEAEEHARFASALNNKPQAQNIADYENELKKLRNQQKKDRRDADEVTQTMVQECQALLGLFGLPYITAPMEAEAQCAELVRLGLVDGIVTDDSDCFLFGGTRIYKNMFNQAKFVECYLASDLEKEFDLTRQKLISVANLLGSDYTEGLPGVGPVTALEIISEFPNLEEFRDWWTAVQMNQIPKSEDAANPFRKKFRRNASKLFLPHGFPDKRVEMAYLEPEVDSDPQAFQWGVPDLEKLRSFLMATIGWTQERTDEVLVPVIRDMNRRLDDGTQSNITAFFAGGVGVGAAGPNSNGEAFAPRKRVEPSKRMGSALTRMAERAKQKHAPRTQEADQEEEVDADHATTSARTKRKPAAAAANGTASDTEGSEFDGPATKKRKRRPAAKRRGKAKVDT